MLYALRDSVLVLGYLASGVQVACGGSEPLTVNFTAAGVDSGGHPVNNWNWNFGDGSTSTAQNPSHTYTRSGTFSVNLTATNSLGLTVTGAGPAITVSPLTVAFGAVPLSGLAPLTANFTSASVDNGGYTITSWNWSFGDGSTSTSKNPSHTYVSNGIYSPALLATNNLGLVVTGVGPASVSALLPIPHYTNFNVVHTFNGTNGANPWVGPTLWGNTLYGTTQASLSPIRGTVFSFNDAALNETVLVHFPDLLMLNYFENYDGANPKARVMVSANKLYGTTSVGGQAGFGNLFSLDTQTKQLISLHAFSATTNNTNSDGASPQSALVLVGDTLYGTALTGGSHGYGTVFAFNTANSNFATIHTFTGGDDGAFPWGDLIVAGDTLYGTANAGGSHGYGTVFRLTTSGSNFVSLYSFTGGADWAYPQQGPLLLSSNTLYGTTGFGGSHGFGTNGSGTVFSLSASGSNFTSLYSFSGGADGAAPCPGLIMSGPTLYGAAFSGGAVGNGTIYSLDLGARGSNFTILYSFPAAYGANRTNSAGANPTPGLVLSENVLYGTARYGGTYDYGTLFAVPLPGSAPAPIPLNIQFNAGSLLLSWNDAAFSLQSAPTITGVFTNIPGATPPYTNIITDPQRFFRLITTPP